MSSQIPTRRVTRTTRANADENATRRTTRPVRAGKEAAAGSAPTISVLKDTTATSKATAADNAQKRKREALGEVTNGKGRNAVALKGKEKDTKDAAPAKAVTRPAAREPLRPVARKTRTSSVVQPHVDGDEDDAMNIDQPNDSLPASRLARRVPAHTALASKVSSSAAAGASRRSTSSKLVSVELPLNPRDGLTRLSRGVPTGLKHVEEDEDEEDEPVHKKRRTSSEADELEQRDLQTVSQVEDDLDVPSTLVFEEEDGADAGWQDLDAEDAEDPLMVSEYVTEIFDYLRLVEETTMPNPDYMDAQEDLGWSMRGILTDWLIQVHARFRFLPETLFLAINILDRFLSARLVSVNKFQLVGVASLFIAAKTEEMFAPGIENWIFIADSAFSEAELLQAEKYVLKTLDWNLSYPSPINFLRRVSKADEYNIQVRTVAKYFLEISVVDWRLLNAKPSLLAAASIWLGRLVLDQGEWTPNLVHYSFYTERAILPVANAMLNYILRPVKHENFNKKYASRKFYKASFFVRSWATTRWKEGTIVNLADELPLLRAAIAERRERNEAAEDTGLGA